MNSARWTLSILIPTLCLLISIRVPAESLPTEQPSPREMADALGIDLPSLPWHLVDVWWNFSAPTPQFDSLSVDITIDRDISPDYNLYLAPVGVAQINGLQFYGGLQSNINGWPSPDDHTRIHPGKGAIFSRWSHDKKQPIGLGHVRTAADGLCESAGYEGAFCSIRRPFAWTRGTYTYSIIKGDTEQIDDQSHTWFHCLVRAHDSDRTTYIGSLRFEGADFSFWARHAAFVEIYATQPIPRSGIPKVIVTIGSPRINGATPAVKRVSAHYNPSQSPACATARADGDNVIIEVGALFKRGEEEGHHDLDVRSPDAKDDP